MTITNHAVTGALVAAAINKPILALPAALLSHFVIDVIPHWDHKLPGHLAMQQLGLVLDLVLGMLMLFVLAITVDASPWLIVLGGLIAVAPDGMWMHYFINGKPAKVKKGSFIDRVRKFHLGIQLSETKNGFYYELAWLVFTLFLIYQL